MHESVMEWGQSLAARSELAGKRVCEVGSRDVNGSFRAMIERAGPVEYVGIDLEPGTGVDVVDDVEHYAATSGRRGQFDLVICTEVLEHVERPVAALNAIRSLVAPDGEVWLTARGPGFPRHEWPGDHWRFREGDMSWAFSDFDILDLRPDPSMPGVFIRARRPPDLAPMPPLSESTRVFERAPER